MAQDEVVDDQLHYPIVPAHQSNLFRKGHLSEELPGFFGVVSLTLAHLFAIQGLSLRLPRAGLYAYRDQVRAHIKAPGLATGL
jgi:hypothetical protein